MFGRLFEKKTKAEGGGTAAARKIPAGWKHLSEDGTLKFEGQYSGNDFDAAELERLVGEYGPAIKAVDLE